MWDNSHGGAKRRDAGRAAMATSRAAGVVLQRTAVASLKRLRFVLQGPPLKGDDYARSKHLSEGTSEALIGRRPGRGGRHGNDRVERRTTRLGIGRGTADHDAGRSNLELFLARQRLGLDLGPEPYPTVGRGGTARRFAVPYGKPKPTRLSCHTTTSHHGG